MSARTKSSLKFKMYFIRNSAQIIAEGYKVNFNLNLRSIKNVINYCLKQNARKQRTKYR